MSEKFKNELVEILKEETNKKKVKLPKNMDFDRDDKGIRVTLTKKACGCMKKDNSNMQEDTACFEGWVIAIRAWCKERLDWNGNIILDVEASELSKLKNGCGHYGRFLYRVLRFREQYDWFNVTQKIDIVIEDFKTRYLNGECTNNTALGDAGENEKLENKVESILAKTDGLFQSIMSDEIPEISNDIFRQLPCGLFENEVLKKNTIFTGGKSAIDLWNYSVINGKNVMTISELKADNKMVGIITEAFFYANYCNDLFGKSPVFKKNKIYSDDSRGYNILATQKMDKINAVLLADIFHPLVNSNKVINELNNNNAKIEYFIVKYLLTIGVSKMK